MSSLNIEQIGAVTVVEIDRPASRNAVDGTTAALLADAFRAFAADDTQSVAVLTGAGGVFCAGADLKAVAAGRGNRVVAEGDGPMGPTRMLLDKPVIAAVEGYAVAGGLELALWCDLRVAARDAVFGVFCRRWGVPLVDGGTVRLAGLANRLVEPGEARAAAVALATDLAALPQVCMRNDRLSSYEQWSMTLDDALHNEYRHGVETLASGEAVAGATRFREGAGRHGIPE